MRNVDTALWEMGRNAYLKLPSFASINDFESWCSPLLKALVKFEDMEIGESITVRDETLNEVSDPARLFARLLALHCLRLIDGALICFVLDSPDATDFIVAATNAMASIDTIESSGEISKHIRQQMATKGAAARLRNDPKQAEKDFVFECWKKWQESPTHYKSKAAFARDMIDKCEHLTSTKKVEDWCREWTKQSELSKLGEH